MFVYLEHDEYLNTKNKMVVICQIDKEKKEQCAYYRKKQWCVYRMVFTKGRYVAIVQTRVECRQMNRHSYFGNCSLYLQRKYKLYTKENMMSWPYLG